VENEGILKQFTQIEQKVEKLIDICKSLEATNSELKTKIADLEGELQSKVAAETQFNEDRDLIRSRIDSLLVKLDDVSET
jgi:hypothetical protein